MKKITIWIFALMLLSLTANAQTDEQRNFNSWWSAKVKTDVSNKFYINSQISLRRYDFLASWQKIILRTRGLYRINEFIAAGVGYTYSRNFTYNQPDRYKSIPRSDIFTEVGFTNIFDKLKLINRFRLEHRFTGIMILPEDEMEDAYIDGTEFSNRVRYRITFKYPLKEVDGNTLIYAAGFYELFLSMTKNFEIKNINSNVFKLACGYRFTDKTTLEVGYRRQIKLKRSFTLKEINTVLDVSMKYRFDLKDALQKKLLRYMSQAN